MSETVVDDVFGPLDMVGNHIRELERHDMSVGRDQFRWSEYEQDYTLDGMHPVEWVAVVCGCEGECVEEWTQ